MSVWIHVGLLALLTQFGIRQQTLRAHAADEADVASSLRETDAANSARRLQDLATIERLLQQAATPPGRAAPTSAPRPQPHPKARPPGLAAVSAPPVRPGETAQPVPPAQPVRPAQPVPPAQPVQPAQPVPPAQPLQPAQPVPPVQPLPTTPAAMVRRARELARAIDTLDRDEQAKALARLTGASSPGEPAGEGAGPSARDPSAARSGAPVTAEAAASEIAALDARARAALARGRQRLAAQVDGVPVDGASSATSATSAGPGAGQGADGGPGATAGRAGGAGPGGSLLAQMTDLLATAVGPGTGEYLPSYRSTRYSGEDIFDHRLASIPPVDANGLVLGRGRILGQGGEYANRVYLNSWYVIGPFPGRHGAGMFANPSYPPEKAVLLDAEYRGKDGRILKWRYVTAHDYPFVPPDIVEDSVYYGYTEVRVDQACDLEAWIGADDDVQIYLNDQLVWKGGNVGKASYFDAIFNQAGPYLREYNRTEGKRLLHFRKGDNTLFFKLSNGPNSAFLSFVLTRP